MENGMELALKVLDEIKADMEKMIAQKFAKVKGEEAPEGSEEVVGMEIEAKPLTGEEASSKMKEALGGMMGEVEEEEEDEDETEMTVELPRWKQRMKHGM